MLNQKLLAKSNQRKKVQNNISSKDMNLPMEDFLLKCYEVCTPNKYGALFPKKIILDNHGIVQDMSSTLGRGDCHINYDWYYECKISYRNQNGKYSITNIRPWQNFNFFILCFVDIENGFKARFYVIPKEIITDNDRIQLTGMNNDKKINSKNKFVGMRASIEPFDLQWLFKKSNQLRGTSYKNLQAFLKQLKFTNKK